jgi:hypothetical protein
VTDSSVLIGLEHGILECESSYMKDDMFSLDSGRCRSCAVNLGMVRVVFIVLPVVSIVSFISELR